jgi:biopolymer transport protein ExbD
VRFKSVRFESSVPTVNLVPMLDVVTVILCFFVLTAMTLTSEPTVVDVALPGQEDEAASASANQLPEFLAVQVDPEGKISVDGKYSTKEQLLQDIPAYLQNNPENSVYVIPDPGMPYEKVMQLLVEMRKVGGDRVSLAVGGQ